jgi:hypothetical protein
MIVTAMNITDDLLDQSEVDWKSLLSGWVGLLPEEFTIWQVNRFGDVIAVLNDGAVYLLDAGAGTFDRVAESRDHFLEQMDRGENADNWLLVPLVDACVAAGLVPLRRQCYGWKMPMLGGSYSLDNVGLIDLAEYHFFLSDVWRQTKDLPDGTRIRVVVK